MIKPDDPRQLALDLQGRSTCAVKVGAVITDRHHNIMAWGWNHMGLTGLGEHAEAAAIRRANKWRLEGATMWVAGRRSRPVFSKPCLECARLLRAWNFIGSVYTTSTGWEKEHL